MVATYASESTLAEIVLILERSDDISEWPEDEQQIQLNGPWRSLTERRAALLRLRARKIVMAVNEKKEDGVWKPIRGYEDRYEVSDQGLVRSLDRSDAAGRRAEGKVLRPLSSASGHLRVTLRRGNESKRYWVHRLVLEAFVGPMPAGTEACHNDGNPKNNVPSNLRWDTKSANARDSVRHGRNKNGRKTHCPHGHEYSPENTYYSAKGWRHCRTCVLAGQERARRRLAGQEGN